jgi:hypothetical protein
LEKSDLPQSIAETQETEQFEEVTKDPGMPLHDAMFFSVPSVHAWHVQFRDRAEEQGLLVRNIIPVDDPDQPFVLQPLQIAGLRLAPSTVPPSAPTHDSFGVMAMSSLTTPDTATSLLQRMVLTFDQTQARSTGIAFSQYLFATQRTDSAASQRIPRRKS